MSVERLRHSSADWLILSEVCFQETFFDFITFARSVSQLIIISEWTGKQTLTLFTAMLSLQCLSIYLSAYLKLYKDVHDAYVLCSAFLCFYLWSVCASTCHSGFSLCVCGYVMTSHCFPVILSLGSESSRGQRSESQRVCVRSCTALRWFRPFAQNNKSQCYRKTPWCFNFQNCLHFCSFWRKYACAKLSVGMLERCSWFPRC